MAMRLLGITSGRRWAMAAGVAAVLGVAVVIPGSPMAMADKTPSATSFDGLAAVGGIFPQGTSAGVHACTGTAIKSSSQNLVLTAAHCVSGKGQKMQFVPGFHDGKSPNGVWDVSAVYVDPRWTSGQDPQHDYAVLAVKPNQNRNLGDAVAALPVGTAPAAGDQVQVIAYPFGFGLTGKPITCTVPTRATDGYPTFDCSGFSLGTSGAPWLAPTDGSTPSVRGVIGGLHQGGCTDSTSFSSSFDQDVATLIARADSGATGDTVPVASDDDGC